MNWLYYLLEANLYLSIFYIGYYLFLSRETFYNLNRACLLFSCIAAFVLPVMQLDALKPVTTANLAFTPQTAIIMPARTVVMAPAFNWGDAIIYAYLIGACMALIVLSIKLYRLSKLTRFKDKHVNKNYKVVYLSESNTAFSFFNYLFIGTGVQQADTIIKHELVHIRQKHSADIIFMELLKIVNWFNPFIYLLQYSLREIHEYIADEKTAMSGTGAIAYSSFLVDNAYGLAGSSVTHSFFNYNLLKKRIIMLHQKRSGKLAGLKYLVMLPVCAALLCVSTLAFSKTYGWVDIGPHRINPANKSAQVPEPKTMLVVVDNGEKLITDKFSAKRADGSTRIYTAHNLSNKDREDLKKQGISIDVVTIDTDKRHSIPPPPPAPPAARRRQLPPPPPPVPPAQVTKKGYRYAETGYLVNGKTDFRVIITEKNGSQKAYFKNRCTPAEIRLLKNKYGYTFPDMLLYARLPPPPPAPPVIRPDGKTPPPPVPPVMRHDTKNPPPPPAPPVIRPDGKTPPPPVPPAASADTLKTKNVLSAPEKSQKNAVNNKNNTDKYIDNIVVQSRNGF